MARVSQEGVMRKMTMMITRTMKGRKMAMTTVVEVMAMMTMRGPFASRILAGRVLWTTISMMLGGEVQEAVHVAVMTSTKAPFVYFLQTGTVITWRLQETSTLTTGETATTTTTRLTWMHGAGEGANRVVKHPIT
jgi:hypothetical protein